MAALAFGALLGLPVSAAAQGRPDCAAIVRALHETKGRDGASPNADKVGKRMGTDGDWVERCAQSYGRHVKREPTPEEGESDKQFSEKREVEEYDEISREEKETAGDRYYTTIENDDEDRRRLRASQDEDTNNEWDPVDDHEWEPHLDHVWQPTLLDDDHPGEE